MRRLGKAELVADFGDGCGLMQHGVDCLLHPHDVEIDLWRYTDGRLEQAEKMRAREPGIPGKGFEGCAALGFGPHGSDGLVNTPVAGARARWHAH